MIHLSVEYFDSPWSGYFLIVDKEYDGGCVDSYIVRVVCVMVEHVRVRAFIAVPLTQCIAVR